ncbi:MAG: riboflavin biosynthesis protein RibF [Planctomycetales bacterium]|nr:riboflavin biosynthesis protein RibF [Planctomycetales bacterium]
MIARLSLDDAGGRYASGPRPVATLGFFDGVHRGHRAVLDEAVRAAREAGGEVVAVTFDRHPRETLVGVAPPLLTPASERLRLLGEAGAAAVVVVPFDRAQAAVPAEEFAREVFARRLRAGVVALGARSRFGRGGQGTPEDLAGFGTRLGFSVRVVPPLMAGGEPISSTRIRDRLLRGDLDGAADLLGRPVAWVGTVVPGRGDGRALGFPTANLDMPGAALPPDGVYACRARLGDATFRAAANVGVSPTFTGPGGAALPRAVEVHLIGFSGDLYGRELRVEVLRKLRDERKFPSLEALREQIRSDVEAVAATQ